MNYKKLIDPELKKIARKTPYNKAVLFVANIYQTIAFALTKVPQVITERTIAIKGFNGLKMKVNVFEPKNYKSDLPCLIYVHGGAFSYKASVYQKKLACIYAAKVKCRVFFPDYHLIPKYAFPAPYKDVVELYKYLMANSSELRINSKKIGITGESAGGLLSALVSNNYKKELIEKPCFQMLIYPLTDSRMETESMKKYTDTPLWNSISNKKMWEYFSEGMESKKKAASPMLNDLPHEIPKTYIETTEYDCLRDEGILYAKKLRDAGACVELNDVKRAFHGYDSAIKSSITIKNVKKRIAFMRKCFM